MIVSFLSLDEEKNKTFFQSEATKHNNEIVFEDKSSPNTTIKLTFSRDMLILERFGFIETRIHFCMDKLTQGFYKSQDGLEFQFTVHTLQLCIEEMKFKAKYEMWMEEEKLSTHTFQVSLYENA